MVGHSVHCDLSLFHGFEKSALGLGSGPIDLVHQDDLMMQRPGPEFEGTLLLVVDLNSGQIGGKQVRRALNPGEIAAQAPGQTLSQNCLAHSGSILQKDVTAGQKGDDDMLNSETVPSNNFANVVQKSSGRLTGYLRGGRQWEGLGCAASRHFLAQKVHFCLLAVEILA